MTLTKLCDLRDPDDSKKNVFSILNISPFILRVGYDILPIETPGKLDIDLICIQDEQAENKRLKGIKNMDDLTRETMQHMLRDSKSSSHRCCVLKNTKQGEFAQWKCQVKSCQI